MKQFNLLLPVLCLIQVITMTFAFFYLNKAKRFLKQAIQYLDESKQFYYDRNLSDREKEIKEIDLSKREP